VSDGSRRTLTRRSLLGGAVVLAAAGVSVGIVESRKSAASSAAAVNRVANLTAGPVDASAVVFAPDGASLFGCAGTQIQQWDTASWQPGRLLTSPLAEVNGLAVNPGSTLLACSADAVYVWNAKTGQQLKNLGETGDIANATSLYTCLEFSADGRLLAVGDQHGVIGLWNTSTWALEGKLKGHSGAVNGVAFSPNGRTLMSGSQDTTARVWSLSSLQCTDVLQQTAAVSAVSFSSDGSTFTTAADNVVEFWNAATNRGIGTVGGFALSVSGTAFIPGSHVAVAADQNGDVKLCSQVAGSAQTQWNTSGSIYGISVSSDGKLVAAAEQDGVVEVWSIEALRSANAQAT